MPIRYAFDMGEKSIGWCVFETGYRGDVFGVTRLVDTGVRIFESGRESKTGKPLAVERRLARSIRRNRDRFKRRQKKLMNALIRHGLMPPEEHKRKKLEKRDPYKLRAASVNREISPYDTGRALFHLNQRRGYKSNSKTDKQDSDAGKVKGSIDNTKEMMEAKNCRTLGEFLHQNDSKRARPHPTDDKRYVLYPSREMTEEEFNLIWETQAGFHPDVFTEDAREELHDIIFFQRPLKPQPRGLCRFEWSEGELRCYKALPSFQRFRVLQEINNLQFTPNTAGGKAEPLSPEHKHLLQQALLDNAHELPKNGVLTFGKMRKVIGEHRSFTLEQHPGIKGLTGDIVTRKIADVLNDNDDPFLIAKWLNMKPEQREAIMILITGEDRDHGSPHRTDEEIISELQQHHLPGCSEEECEALINANFVEGTASVSRVAIAKMLPGLEAGRQYHDVATEIYGAHTVPRGSGALDKLPYYGALLKDSVVPAPHAKAKDERVHGKIHNPTVHIALNQLRKIVNALIEEYGKPDEIVIELARELKLTQEQRKKVEKTIKDNTGINERIKEKLESVYNKKPTRANMMRYKLWEDLAESPTDRGCPFCGEPIPESRVFAPEFEVEHLIPFSKCLDDKRRNKVLACRECNRKKRDKTPFQAFGDNAAGWQAICERVEKFPEAAYKAKHKRFAPDAAEKFADDMIARQLTDTQYIARIAKRYLGEICNEDKIWSSPGQLTAMLREKWRVNLSALKGENDNIKTRHDHRHHAVDAFVTGCTDRGTLNRISRASDKAEKLNLALEDVRDLLPEQPYPGFREELREAIDGLHVSHRPDHKLPSSALFTGDAEAAHMLSHNTAGGLHNDTFYGRLSDEELRKSAYGFTEADLAKLAKSGQGRYILRVPADTIEDKKQPFILDADLRERAHGAMAQDGVSLKTFLQREGIRRVRLFEDIAEEAMIAFTDDEGKEYKFARGNSNFCADIYMPLEGKKAGTWQCEIITSYNAHRPDFIPDWRREDAPKAEFVMRVMNNDMITYEKDGKTLLNRVRKMSGGRIVLAPHTLCYSSEKSEKQIHEKACWTASAPQLQKHHARKAAVDVISRLHEAGRVFCASSCVN